MMKNKPVRQRAYFLLLKYLNRGSVLLRSLHPINHRFQIYYNHYLYFNPTSTSNLLQATSKINHSVISPLIKPGLKYPAQNHFQ